VAVADLVFVAPGGGRQEFQKGAENFKGRQIYLFSKLIIVIHRTGQTESRI